MTNLTKICNECKTDKPLTSFSRQHTAKDGYRTICKECLAKKSRTYLLMRRFGLTEEDYAAILDAQGHRCALCGSMEPKGRWSSFVVDHDHETGRVRGILCPYCNTALGILGDTQAALKRAFYYVSNQSVA